MSRPVALALAGFCALAAGMGIGRFAYTPLLPYMQRDLGLAIAAAGYVASANFAGYLAGALLAIRVSRARRNAWFAAGLAASVLTTVLMAVAQAAWPMAALRAVSGIASAFILIHGSAIVLDMLAREGRPALFSLLYAGVGSGIALTALLVEAASRAFASSDTMWLVLGAAAALLAIPAFRLRDPPPATAAPATTAGPGAASATGTVAPPARTLAAAADRSTPRAMSWLIAAYACLGFGYVITATFIVVMVRGRADWIEEQMRQLGGPAYLRHL